MSPYKNQPRPFRKVVDSFHYRRKHMRYDATNVCLTLECGHKQYRVGSKPVPNRARCEECAVIELSAQLPIDQRPVGGIGIDQGQFLAACEAWNQIAEGGTFGGTPE